MRAHAHARGRKVIDQPSAADAGGADSPGDMRSVLSHVQVALPGLHSVVSPASGSGGAEHRVDSTRRMRGVGEACD